MAAAVILPFECIIPELNDSKQLTPQARERCRHCIIQKSRAIGTGIVDAQSIDAVNILAATHEAMKQALLALPWDIQPDIALIDGLPVASFPLTHWAIVKGDALSASIAAASVVAKVTRDEIMTRLADTYPVYGFDSNKGYGSAAHLAALKQYGPCPLHRKTFRPVSQMLQHILP